MSNTNTNTNTNIINTLKDPTLDQLVTFSIINQVTGPDYIKALKSIKDGRMYDAVVKFQSGDVKTRMILAEIKVKDLSKGTNLWKLVAYAIETKVTKEKKNAPKFDIEGNFRTLFADYLEDTLWEGVVIIPNQVFGDKGFKLSFVGHSAYWSASNKGGEMLADMAKGGFLTPEGMIWKCKNSNPLPSKGSVKDLDPTNLVGDLTFTLIEIPKEDQ